MRNPGHLRPWERYIDHKIRTKADPKQVRLVFERALKLFNRSYKLWYGYLRYRRKIIVHKPPSDMAYAHLCDAYERCLVFMNKVTGIYLSFYDTIVYCLIICQDHWQYNNKHCKIENWRNSWSLSFSGDWKFWNGNSKMWIFRILIFQYTSNYQSFAAGRVISHEPNHFFVI